METSRTSQKNPAPAPSSLPLRNVVALRLALSPPRPLGVSRPTPCRALRRNGRRRRTRRRRRRSWLCCPSSRRRRSPPLAAQHALHRTHALGDCRLGANASDGRSGRFRRRPPRPDGVPGRGPPDEGSVASTSLYSLAGARGGDRRANRVDCARGAAQCVSAAAAGCYFPRTFFCRCSIADCPRAPIGVLCGAAARGRLADASAARGEGPSAAPCRGGRRRGRSRRRRRRRSTCGNAGTC